MFRNIIAALALVAITVTAGAQVPDITTSSKFKVFEGNNHWVATLAQIIAAGVNEPAGQVVFGTGTGIDSESWLQADATDDNIKIGWSGNTADTGLINLAPPSGYSGAKAMINARDAVNLLKYKRGTMPAWWMQQKAGSNGDGTTNNVLELGYNQYNGVSTESASDVKFGISMEPHWVSGEGDTVSEFHVFFNDLNGVTHRPFTGFFDFWNPLESYWSFQVENLNIAGTKGNLHGKMNINRQNGSTALYPLEVYKHKKTLTTTNTSFSRAELDSATVFVLGNYNTGGESPQLGLSTLMRFTNTQDRRATFYMGLLDIEGSFDGGADFIGFHQNSGVFRESFRIADNTGYFGIGLRGGNRPLQLLDVNGTALFRGSGRFNAPGDSSVLHLKSAGGATAKMMDLANTAGDVNVFVTSSTPESSVTGSPGDVAISTAGAMYLKETGSASNTGWSQLATGVATNSIKTYYLTRTLQASNNTIELGIFNHTGGGAGYAEIATVVNNGAGNSIAKKYLVPFYFGNTGGNWQNLLPISNTGAYSGNDYKLEMRSSSTRDTLRVRTVSGSTGGTLLVTITVTPYQGSSSTFTETTTTWTAPTAVTETYNASPYSAEGKTAGINRLSPRAALDIIGTGASSSTEALRVSNSSDTRQLTVRNDGRTSIGNNGSPARTLDVTGEVRISDLTTDTPTKIVGADADGDLNAVTPSSELSLDATTLKLAQQGATSGQVLEWNGSAWAPATDDTGSGTVYNQVLRDDGTDKTQRNAVNFVNTTTITSTLTDDGANGETEVTFSIPTDGVTATEIAAGAVGSSEIAADAVGQSEIATDGVGELEIEAGAVGSSEVSNNSLLADDLAVNVVSSVDGVTNDGGDVDFVAGANVTITPSDAANTVTFDVGASNQTTSQFTGDQDNLSPTNWSTRTTHYVSGDATLRAITGFADLPDGTVRRLVNNGSYSLYLPASHPDSDLGHRLAGRSDQILPPGGVVEMYYAGPDSAWRITQNTFNPANMPDAGVVGQYYRANAGATVAADWGELGLATASGGNGQTAPTSALPGSFDINTASSASGVATLYFADGVVNPVEIGSAHIVTSCVVYFPTLSDGSQTYTFQFGIIPTPTSTTLNVNNSVGIRYTNGTNSGKWQGFSRDNAGSESTADLGTTVAANTAYVLTVCYDKARSEGRFYVNGAYSGRVTGNMPNATDAGSRAGIFKSAGTTSRTAAVASLTLYTIY